MKAKKIFAGILTAVLLCAMFATNAFAQTTGGSITVKNATPEKTYNIYRIFDLSYSETEGKGNYAYTINADWSAFFGAMTPEITTDKEAYDYVQNLDTEAMTTFAKSAIEYAITKGVAPTASKVAAGETVTFDNLVLGYYLMYPQGGLGSVCSLTTTNPDSEVDVKDTYPTIDKVADKTLTNVGDVITFTVTGVVPDTTGYQTYLYKISDTMSAGLTFNKDVTVTFGENEITDIAPVLSDNGFTLTYDMTAYQAYVGKTITVTYTATVNENAVMGTTGNTNTVNLEYSNNPSDTSSTVTTPDVDVTVYSYAFSLNKVDNADKPLTGATFKLYDKEGNQIYVVDNQDGSYTVTATPNDTLISAGNVVIKGLKPGEYALEEITAPEGYNKLTAKQTFTITADNEVENGIVENVKVVNNTGTILPGTGGIGTTIFYVAGGLLMLGAVVVLVAKKKTSVAKEN